MKIASLLELNGFCFNYLNDVVFILVSTDNCIPSPNNLSEKAHQFLEGLGIFLLLSLQTLGSVDFCRFPNKYKVMFISFYPVE